MNLKRVISGPLLSLVFLFFFVYAIFGVKWIFDNSIENPEFVILTGSVSDAVWSVASQDIVDNSSQPADILISNPEIIAEAAISVESNLQGVNKIFFEKNSDIKFPIASLTKLMTAVVVLDNYNLSDTIVVDKAADLQDAMKQDVKLGDTMTVEDFLYVMLIESSNKAAYALSEGPAMRPGLSGGSYSGFHPGEQKFVELMNQKAKELGLKDTFFVDPTGLSPEDVSTANDLAKFAEYILKSYPKIADISKMKEFYVPNFGKVENTDQLLGEVPDIVCSKTGFTTIAKGCLLLVVNNSKNNDYLINIVLGADDRFSEMKKLLNWVSTTCK